MGIYLLSLSHKTTPLEVRSLFAYSEEGKVQVLEGLLASEWIDEAVALSTCNRMEIYCHSTDQENDPVRQVLGRSQISAVISAATMGGRPCIICFGWQQDWTLW